MWKNIAMVLPCGVLIRGSVAVMEKIPFFVAPTTSGLELEAAAARQDNARPLTLQEKWERLPVNSTYTQYLYVHITDNSAKVQEEAPLPHSGRYIYMYTISSAPENHKALGNVLVNVFHAIGQYMYVGHSVQMKNNIFDSAMPLIQVFNHLQLAIKNGLGMGPEGEWGYKTNYSLRPHKSLQQLTVGTSVCIATVSISGHQLMAWTTNNQSFRHPARSFSSLYLPGLSYL